MSNKITNLAEKFAGSFSRREFFKSAGLFSGAALAVAALSGRLSAQPLAARSLKCCYDCSDDGKLVKAVTKSQACPSGTVAVVFTGRSCPTGIDCGLLE